MHFLRSNSQIIDTAEGNLSVRQLLGVDIDSGTVFGNNPSQNYGLPAETSCLIRDYFHVAY